MTTSGEAAVPALRLGRRATRSPAVPVGLVRPAAVLATVGLVALVVLGLVVRGGSRPGPLDQVVDVAVRRHTTVGPFAYAVDGLVAPLPALVVVGVLAAACVALGRGRLALVAVAGPLGSYLVTSAVKPLVGRTIHGHNLSFPSGHAAFATAVGLVVALLLVGRLRIGPWLGTGVVLLLGLLCGLGMAADQVLLDAHYPTDTVGGILVALALVPALGLALDAVVPRLRRSRDRDRT